MKSADKGGAVVVWRSDLYKEALRQRSDTSLYAKVEKDLTSNNQKIVKDTIQNLIVKQELPATATNLIMIITTCTPRTSSIYFLPKIHKPNNPGRPIVSACSCLAELISSYLDKVMAPIVKSLPSYIKDSQHALEIFRDFKLLKLLLKPMNNPLGVSPTFDLGGNRTHDLRIRSTVTLPTELRGRTEKVGDDYRWWIAAKRK